MAWFAPKELKADRIYSYNGVTINECLLKNHNLNKMALPTKRTKPFKGVVIHNTLRANSADDGRQYTAATLNDAVATKTHYYVTDIGAWKNLEDDEMNWSCGDGTQGAGNNGCISLEIIMSSSNQEIDLKARDNGAKIAAAILAEHNMTVNDMYTHNYFLNIRNGVTGDYNKLCTTPTPTRNCPCYIVGNWNGFRELVSKYIELYKTGKITNTNIIPDVKKDNILKTNNKGIYKAISNAAIREGMSKKAKIVGRVIKNNYYPADNVDGSWIKHVDCQLYSLLVDGSALFEKIGNYKTKKVTTKLNVRQAPTTKSNIIIAINQGSTLYTFDESPIFNDGLDWQKIVLNNQIGYVAAKYLE